MTRRISYSKFSDVLPAFTYASIVGNLRSICLRVNILSPSQGFTLYLFSDSKIK